MFDKDKLEYLKKYVESEAEYYDFGFGKGLYSVIYKDDSYQAPSKEELAETLCKEAK